jgi:hypothetical protein
VTDLESVRPKDLTREVFFDPDKELDLDVEKIGTSVRSILTFIGEAR